MQLKQYLKIKNLSQNEFSYIAGISQALLSKIINKRSKNVSAFVALKVQEATRRQVTAYDLIGPSVCKKCLKEINKRLNTKG